MAKEGVKKNWFRVVAGEPFNNAEIGEAMGETAEGLIGRPVRINMMTISGHPQAQNISLDFVITGINSGALVASPIKYAINVPAVKRIVRRSKDKIEDSFIITTADGKKMRIKPLLVTRTSTTRGVLKKVRAVAKEYLLTETGKLKVTELFNAVAIGALQKALNSAVRKTYPVAISEIRCLEIVHEKKKEMATE